MKAWRRGCRVIEVGAALSSPLVQSVAVDELNDSNIFVFFDQAVTWNGVGSGTFEVNANPITWIGQLDGATLKGTGAGPFSSGDSWDWMSPDSSLSPVPDPGQTGTI